MEDLTGKMQELLNDPESMQQIAELASMLQGGGDGEAAQPGSAAHPAGGLDPALLMRLSQLMQAPQEPDRNTQLLLALKPYLGERRQSRTDKAIRMLRLYGLWKTAQRSGILRDLI